MNKTLEICVQNCWYIIHEERITFIRLFKEICQIYWIILLQWELILHPVEFSVLDRNCMNTRKFICTFNVLINTRWNNFSLMYTMLLGLSKKYLYNLSIYLFILSMVFSFGLSDLTLFLYGLIDVVFLPILLSKLFFDLVSKWVNKIY